MMEKNKVFRILKIITLLESGYKRWSAKDFANFFGINVRTFHRDRELMEELNIPIYYNKEKKTYEFLDTFRFTSPNLTRQEAIALYLAGQAIEDEYFPYHKELNTGLAKIITSLPASIRKVLEGIKSKITFQRKPVVDLSCSNKNVIKKIEQAIEKRRIIKIKYYSLSRDSTDIRKVNPYTILFNKAGYLIAYCHIHSEIRLFRIDRIKKIIITKDKFKRPDNYSIDEYLKNAWGVERGKTVEVKVIFSGFAAKFVQEFNWHPSQSIKKINNDSILFSIKTGSLHEIKSWIMGFGCEAKILEPEKLRQEVVDEIEKMQKEYKKHLFYDDMLS